MKKISAKIIKLNFIDKLKYVLQYFLLSLLMMEWVFISLMISFLLIKENMTNILNKDLITLMCLFMFLFIVVFIIVKLCKNIWNKLNLIELLMFNETFDCKLLNETDNEVIDTNIFYCRDDLGYYLSQLDDYIKNENEKSIVREKMLEGEEKLK